MSSHSSRNYTPQPSVYAPSSRSHTSHHRLFDDIDRESSACEFNDAATCVAAPKSRFSHSSASESVKREEKEKYEGKCEEYYPRDKHLYEKHRSRRHVNVHASMTKVRISNGAYTVEAATISPCVIAMGPHGIVFKANDH